MSQPVPSRTDVQARIRELEAELTHTRLLLEVAHRDRDEYRRLVTEPDPRPAAVVSDGPHAGVTAHPWLDIQIAEMERV